MPCAHFKEERWCLQRLSSTFQGHLLEIETSLFGSDFDIDLLLNVPVPCFNFNRLLQNHSGPYQEASTWHKAVNKMDTSEMLRGVTFLQEKQQSQQNPEKNDSMEW